MRASMFSAALVASLVGYGSTIALVLSAAAALGATPEQSASWVLAICLAKAIGSAGLSIMARVPVVLAWSTAGAALIAATEGVSMAEGVGAFILAGLLIVATGAIRPLGRMIGAIPDAIAAAMLAGVLVPFCLRLAPAATDLPHVVLPMAAVFVAARLWNPAVAVLAALATGLILAFGLGTTDLPPVDFRLPLPVLIMPAFDPVVLIGLGVPLYLVTMASQNLPGFATLRAAGYTPPVWPALLVTGGLSAVSALFGAHTTSMAAITAAICMGDDVDPDRNSRWRVGLVYAAIWTALGLTGTVAVVVLGALPPGLMAAVVGLALLGPLTGALGVAFATAPHRFAAVVTLTVTASGAAAFGVGSAFWGLLAGLVVYGLEQVKSRQR